MTDPQSKITSLALTFDDLKELTGYTHPSDIERCLKQQGVRVFWGKHGCFTTLKALHEAHGLDKAKETCYEPITF